jgi:hypothetical protein
MYTNVMKWDWGNSDSDKIYHDPKTRRESILQNKSCRLMDQLIVKEKFESKNDY